MRGGGGIWSEGNVNANCPPRILTRFKISATGLLALQCDYNTIISISANADGPRDAASRKSDYFPLHNECNHQATSVSQ